ncbi:uncharacterized protein [Rutidosis leptorrhynchoides]|uniref:uncharacterized protein n=1 Tax=Rutidosis leptorrhynchoides TaxID=125765 RepID=UPI003A9A3984
MDIDLDDLDGPSKASSKTGKFAPKNSKFKPVAKPKLEPDLPVPAAVPKVELDDSEPPVYSKTEETGKPNGSTETDTDITDMVVDTPQPQDENVNDNEEDYVVREIDVFFTSSIDANYKLYVLQSPLRPNWRPYELEDRCNKVRVSQDTTEVEVEMTVQVDSENYDAYANDDRAMTKQVVTTAWMPLKTMANHAVGVLTGNQLYISPVHAVVQLRPSMQHSSKKLNITRDEDSISVDTNKEKSTKQSMKQIKLPGAVNDQNADTAEEWIPLKYHGEMSQLSRGYIQNMVTKEASQIQFVMTQSDYIDYLCPATSDKPRHKLASRNALLKLPLEERFKTRLSEGSMVHRFKALKHIAPNDSDEAIFEVLQTHAQLVQGLWVAKNKLKYNNKDSGKELLLRDYAMLEFSKSPIFCESQLPKSSMLTESMKKILDDFAVRRESCRDWKFKELTDDSFIKQYPDIVKEQKRIWDLAEPRIIEIIFPKNTKRSVVDRRPAPKTTVDATPKVINAPPNKNVMLDETREALPKALQKVFQTYKVCSFNQIRQRLRDMAVSENTQRKGTREAKLAAAAADASQEELQKTLKQVAVDIHGSFVLRSSPDHPQYDELRNVVINLLLAEGREGKLKKASIYAAAQMQLKREITTVEYQKVLNELCISKNSAWVLKSGDGPT